jgi:hypothetical protein
VFQDGSIEAVVPSIVKRAVFASRKPASACADPFGPTRARKLFCARFSRLTSPRGRRHGRASPSSDPNVARDLRRLLSRVDCSPARGFPVRVPSPRESDAGRSSPKSSSGRRRFGGRTDDSAQVEFWSRPREDGGRDRFPLDDFKHFELPFQGPLHLSLTVLVLYRTFALV